MNSRNAPKLVSYRCDEGGHIAGYSISIASREQSGAGNIYVRIKADLVAKFGPPAKDSDRYNTLQKNLLAGLLASAAS